MYRSRARVVLFLVVFGALAVVEALITQPEFDLVSGPDWSARAALAHRAASAGVQLPSVTLGVERSARPAVPNGWILLAGGMIVSVLVLAIHARSQLTRWSALLTVKSH